MTPVFYHNPRCGKSRAALALLQERGVTVEVVEYLKTPLDRSTLDRLLTALGNDPAVVRRKEAMEAGLNPAGLNRAERIAALLAHPLLLERPILVVGDKAVIGRPPEKVLELL
ncbi:arsenate reductase (glutaredoxin) [Lacibacterium aquatile]|uniref:Arsenate reductase n=1 Tax=Lacibacterium aquatile TaxID=1168082 RepID=A0ABW5DL33_9PROT